MTRTRVRWGRVATLLTGLVLAGSAVAQSSQGASAEESGPASGGVHVVEPGDSLWEIARGIVGPEGDPRPMVAELREANRLQSSALAVGARLVLPAA